MSSVSGAGGFRDEWMHNIMNSDGKTNSTQSTTQTGQVWNAVFEDENDMGVSVDDFLSLMVAQLQNQDFSSFCANGSCCGCASCCPGVSAPPAAGFMLP